MSNLGWYQTMTTVSKTMGGPVNFVVANSVGGYLLLRIVEGGIKWVIKRVKARNNQKEGKSAEYEVKTYGKDDQGLELKPGEVVKILGRDGDAVLIEKLEADNNPYFVSADFLKRVLGQQFEAENEDI